MAAAKLRRRAGPPGSPSSSQRGEPEGEVRTWMLMQPSCGEGGDTQERVRGSGEERGVPAEVHGRATGWPARHVQGQCWFPQRPAPRGRCPHPATLRSSKTLHRPSHQLGGFALHGKPVLLRPGEACVGEATAPEWLARSGARGGAWAKADHRQNSWNSFEPGRSTGAPRNPSPAYGSSSLHPFHYPMYPRTCPPPPSSSLPDSHTCPPPATSSPVSRSTCAARRGRSSASPDFQAA